MIFNSATTQFSAESATEPVTLDEVKQWCKIELDITEEDDLITELITSARLLCEGYLGMSLIERTVTAEINNPLGNIEIPYGPVVAFTSLTDEDGNEITSDYYKLRGLIYKWLEYPTDNNLTAVYTAGFPDGVPVNYKIAIKNQVLYMYENRGDEKSLAPAVIQSLKPYRRVC